MKTYLRPCVTLCACLFLAFRLVPANPVAQAAAGASKPYLINNSKEIVYYKPEGRRQNPGKHPDGAYPLSPGEALYYPIDAVSTAAMAPGEVFKVPDGSRLVIDEQGRPHGENAIAAAAILLNPFSYGIVPPPCHSFAALANSKPTLARPADIVRPLMY